MDKRGHCTEAELLFEIAVLREKRKVARERHDILRVYELSNAIGKLTADIHRARVWDKARQARPGD